MFNKKYQIILADPPWQQGKGGKKAVRPNSSGGELDYPVLSLEEIWAYLTIASNMGWENHNFFLWVIDKTIWEAEKFMKQIGYKLHARLIWNKVTGIPASFDVRFGHEYLLWFYKGNLMPVAKEWRGKYHSVFTEQVKKHSQKPEIAYRMIENWYPDTEKLELFARKKRDNSLFDNVQWDVWGNEVESDIKL